MNLSPNELREIDNRTISRLVARAKLAEARAERLEKERDKLVTLVRFGFLVTVNGERAKADDVKEPGLRRTLMTVLQAKDTEAARDALAAASSELDFRE